jgi:hypothetical protein
LVEKFGSSLVVAAAILEVSEVIEDIHHLDCNLILHQ